jgi:hypothetical protein
MESQRKVVACDRNPACAGETRLSRSCGAYVCWECDTHVSLARCFCGWSRSGGDGRAELIESGEVIEPDDWF